MSNTAMCPVEEQYRPPEGYYDYPYVYVEDLDQVQATGTDTRIGSNYVMQQVPLQGDSLFVLRKVTRFPVDATDKFMLYSTQQNRIFSDHVDGRASVVFPVVPEMVYQAGASIYYDIMNWHSGTTLAFGAAGPYLYTSQVLFQGVRRFKGDMAYPQPSGYEYREKPYWYDFSFTLDWPHFEFLGGSYAAMSPADPRRFVVEVQDHDFELQRISIIREGSLPLAGGVVNYIGSPSFKIMLYDSDQRSMFSHPIYAAAINQSERGNSRLFPAFPVPPVVYKANSQIMFDITSMLADAAGAGTPSASRFRIVFSGVRRVACGSRYGG